MRWAIIGFGLYPQRAGLWILALVPLGAFIFGFDPAVRLRAMRFVDRLIYSLDALLPFVTLRSEHNSFDLQSWPKYYSLSPQGDGLCADRLPAGGVDGEFVMLCEGRASMIANFGPGMRERFRWSPTWPSSITAATARHRRRCWRCRPTCASGWNPSRCASCRANCRSAWREAGAVAGRIRWRAAGRSCLRGERHGRLQCRAALPAV